MNKQESIFKPQIQELLKYVNYLDERIARCKKQGRSTELLERNRADAMQTVQTLKKVKAIRLNLKAVFRL